MKKTWCRERVALGTVAIVFLSWKVFMAKREETKDFGDERVDLNDLSASTLHLGNMCRLGLSYTSDLKRIYQKKSGCPFPRHPCIVYLPTFTIKINQM